jgi:vanillate O-demethylase monooxygenase subunit
MMKFLRNHWYAAAWSEELAGAPLARTILGEPVALFRTRSGRVQAFEDCCPHRLARLSLGTIEGDTLRCRYHGLRFDCSGACVEIPGQAAIPERARVHAYPTVERWNLVWLWTGRPEAADPDLIPALPWLDSPDWAFSQGTVTYACNYALLCDNLIDLSHTTFSHRGTIGTEDVARTPIDVTADDRRVLVVREMRNTDPSNLYKYLGGFTQKIDRWQRIEYTPPTNIIIDAGAVPAGTNDKARGIDTRVVNMLTPETETSTFHFWAFARDFKLADEKMTRDVADAIVVTFNEDKAIIDGQQINATARPRQRMLDNDADKGVVLARRIMERLVREETAARAP